MKNIAIILLMVHFVADQMIQISAFQINKRFSSYALLGHVLTWTFIMWLFGLAAMIKTGNIMFITAWPLIIMVVHFSAEWLLGRWANYLYDKGSRKGFLFASMLENTIIMMSLILFFDYFAG